MGKPGRPLGRKNDSTIEKEKVAKEIQQQIFKIAHKLINAQLIAAQGTHKIVRLFKKEGVMATEVIRDITRMQELLDTGVYGKDYIILSGAEPDWRAADALINRALGKPIESIEMSGKNGNSIQVDMKAVAVMTKEDVDTFLKNTLNESTERSSRK